MTRACPQGHEIVGENAQPYRKIRNGKEYHYFKCRQCNIEASRRSNRKFEKISSTRECPQCHRDRKIGKHTLCSDCRRFNTQLAREDFRPPDYPDTTIESYKEPMQKVENGFGYYGAITQTKDGRHVQCHICGYFFRSLGTHVANKHKTPVREYRIEYGLRLTESLYSPEQKKLALDRYNANARKSPEEFREMSRKGQIAWRKKGYKPGGGTWSPQTRNERGNCREQTLAKIRHFAEKNDGVLIINSFLAEYGQGQTSTVQHWFGNWQNAIKEAGVKSFADHRKIEIEKLREKTIIGIQRFYKEYGRTPQSADFNDIDYLPNYNAVSHQFGSLNKARTAAGVPNLVYTGRQLGWMEVEV